MGIRDSDRGGSRWGAWDREAGSNVLSEKVQKEHIKVTI